MDSENPVFDVLLLQAVPKLEAELERRYGDMGAIAQWKRGEVQLIAGAAEDVLLMIEEAGIKLSEKELEDATNHHQGPWVLLVGGGEYQLCWRSAWLKRVAAERENLRSDLQNAREAVVDFYIDEGGSKLFDMQIAVDKVLQRVLKFLE